MGVVTGKRLVVANTARTLRVASVDPSGTSANGFPVELTYTAPTTLVGTAGSGQTGYVSYSLSLQRQATPAN